MKNDRNSFFQRFDLPEDLTKDGYHIEVFNSCAVVDGCKNVVEYGEGIIRLNLGLCVVSVIGNNLSIRSFSCGQATVDGHICSIEID